MKPASLSDLLEAIQDFADRGVPFAVVQVLGAGGSTPREIGAMAVVDGQGSIQGTIGGGAVEAAAQQRAVVAIRRQGSEVFEFSLRGAALGETEPVCGGEMRVLVNASAGAARAGYAAALAAIRRRQAGALLTRIRGAAGCDLETRFVEEFAEDGQWPFPGEDTIRAALRSETAHCCREEAGPGDEAVEVLVTPVTPPPLLVIAGGGHVGQALAGQACLAGFAVTVLDDRPEYTRAGLFPDGASARCGSIAGMLAEIPMDHRSHVVIVTRGHQFDAQALAACIRKQAAYIGMIGSRRKVALMRRQFLEEGLATAAEFDRVYAPIGLDIGAFTPSEIAVSILAQIVCVRRTGASPRMPLG